MAKASYTDLTISLDKAAVAKDISQYVTSINGWSKERILEEITAAGDANDRWGAVGILQKSEVVLTGPYDTTADGLFDIASTWTDDSEQTLTLLFSAAGYSQSVECLLSKLEINPSKGAFHTVVVTLRPTGAIS